MLRQPFTAEAEVSQDVKWKRNHNNMPYGFSSGVYAQHNILQTKRLLIVGVGIVCVCVCVSNT